MSDEEGGRKRGKRKHENKMRHQPFSYFQTAESPKMNERKKRVNPIQMPRRVFDKNPRTITC